jgi:hypothetical protein
MLTKPLLTAVFAALVLPVLIGMTHMRPSAPVAVATTSIPTPSETTASGNQVALPSPSFQTHPTPLYLRTGGPYLTVGQALAIALDQRQGAVREVAIGLVAEADAVAWAGGGSSTIDPAREVYMVAMATDWQPPRAKRVGPPCHWLVLVVDATDGIVWSTHCGPEAIVPTLPRQVQRVPVPILNTKP